MKAEATMHGLGKAQVFLSSHMRIPSVVLAFGLILILFFPLLVFAFQPLSETALPSDVQEGNDKPIKIKKVEKVEVRLLLVDAIIEDAEGNQVRGLTKEKFHLSIDGFEKPISVFEEHCATNLREEQKAVTEPGALIEEAEPRYIIFCFGPSRPAWGGPFEAIKAAKKFVQESMRESDSVMVVSCVNDIKVLQDFCSDREKLMKAIDKIATIAPLFFNPSGGRGRWARAGAFGLSLEDDDLNNRIAIKNFRSLFKMVSAIRERKAVVYFCSQLYLTPELSRMINEANSARVSIYTVDMVGLTAPGERNDEAFILNAFSSLSIDTGGKVLKWSNDLTRYIPVIEKDLSCYYLIGCYLDKEADKKQHTLSLVSNDSSLRIRSRTGFIYSSKEKHKNR